MSNESFPADFIQWVFILIKRNALWLTLVWPWVWRCVTCTHDKKIQGLSGISRDSIPKPNTCSTWSRNPNTSHERFRRFIFFNSLLEELLIFKHLLPAWDTLCAAIYWCLTELLGSFAVLGSGTSTSGRHMPSETDVRGVMGHLGPLKQIKEEKWRTTEMNKRLKWLQGRTEQSETLISITQVCVWWRPGLIAQNGRKEALETSARTYKSARKCDYDDNGGSKLHWVSDFSAEL